LYARLHQYALQSQLSNQNNGSADNAIQMLESLPETIRNKPKVQSMIMKQKQSITDQPKLQSESIDDKPTLPKLKEIIQSIESYKAVQFKDHNDMQQYIRYADFALSNQKYTDAVLLYEAVLNSGAEDDLNSEYNTITAKYVRALSYVRPHDAITVWSNHISNNAIIPELIPTDTSTKMSGAELEMQEIIFHHSSASTRPVPNNMNDNDDGVSNDMTTTQQQQQKKKNHEAVLRRRAKKRELYLQQKFNGNTNTPPPPPEPDPERWLPKYERSSYAKYRRYHKKGSHHHNNNTTLSLQQQQQSSKSAQGVVTIQDMAKLDVVAHQTATAAAISAAAAAKDGTDATAATIAALRSTAHMNVSNQGRGGKKRR
jgi:hypothetical protein